MGNIRLYGATSGYTELAPPAVAPDGVLSLPSGTGTLATQAYVDTAESDAIAAGGLVHINTTTFSASGSFSINNVFSATYDNYVIECSGTASADLLVLIRYRVSGTDDTGANYDDQGLLGIGASAVAAQAVNQTSGDLGSWGGTKLNTTNIRVYNPAKASPTTAMSLTASARGDARIDIYTVVHDPSTAYDGFTILTNTGTITGTIRVYGYKNS